MNQFFRTVVLLLMAGVCAFPLQAAQPYFKTAKGFGRGFYVGTTQPLVLDLSGYIEATPGTDTNVVYVSTGAGGFGMQLLPGNAPKTVANFLSYVRSGAYGNTFVHRSVEQFIIQAGTHLTTPSGRSPRAPRSRVNSPSKTPGEPWRWP
jgi:hypothetical protein